jgi:RecJ-like exonuclease
VNAHKTITCSWCRGYGHPFHMHDLCKLCDGFGRIDAAEAERPQGRDAQPEGLPEHDQGAPSNRDGGAG